MLWSFVNAIWFVVVYGGMDFLTARRSFRVPVHFPAELAIPFVPTMTLFYMSIYALFWMTPFVLRTRREFRALVVTLAFAIFCGGIGFLLFPAELAFALDRVAAGSDLRKDSLRPPCERFPIVLRARRRANRVILARTRTALLSTPETNFL